MMIWVDKRIIRVFLLFCPAATSLQLCVSCCSSYSPPPPPTSPLRCCCCWCWCCWWCWCWCWRCCSSYSPPPPPPILYCCSPQSVCVDWKLFNCKSNSHLPFNVIYLPQIDSIPNTGLFFFQTRGWKRQSWRFITCPTIPLWGMYLERESFHQMMGSIDGSCSVAAAITAL